MNPNKSAEARIYPPTLNGERLVTGHSGSEGDGIPVVEFDCSEQIRMSGNNRRVPSISPQPTRRKSVIARLRAISPTLKKRSMVSEMMSPRRFSPKPPSCKNTPSKSQDRRTPKTTSKQSLGTKSLLLKSLSFKNLEDDDDDDDDGKGDSDLELWRSERASMSSDHAMSRELLLGRSRSIRSMQQQRTSTGSLRAILSPGSTIMRRSLRTKKEQSEDLAMLVMEEMASCED